MPSSEVAVAGPHGGLKGEGVGLLVWEGLCPAMGGDCAKAWVTPLMFPEGGAGPE